MKKYKNENNTSLEVAVWLAHDEYDYNNDPMTISTTSLLRGTKQLILSGRITGGEGHLEDISNLVASRMGTAFHDSVEHSWVNGYKSSLEALGMSQNIIDSIRINPEAIEPNTIPVYLEQRSERKVGDYTISGKFDMVLNGRISDIKSTGTFSYTTKNNNDKYIQQLSIYKWLNPDKITEDTGAIQFIFTDWQANRALSSSDYPQSRVVEMVLPLMSDTETEAFIKQKLNAYITNIDKPESEMPPCTPEELWMSDSKWSYYAKTDAKRATKNFDNPQEAYIHLSNKGGKGFVQERKAEPKACNYCNAVKCSQRDSYIASGILKQ